MNQERPGYLGLSLDIFDLADKGASRMQIIQVDTVFMMTMDDAGYNFETFDDTSTEERAKVWEMAAPRIKQVLGEPMFRRYFPPQSPQGQQPA